CRARLRVGELLPVEWCAALPHWQQRAPARDRGSARQPPNTVRHDSGFVECRAANGRATRAWRVARARTVALPSTMIRSRDGIVLPLVLMVLLVVELLAAGTLTLAYLQHSLARERLLALRAQLAARSGTADLAGHWSRGQYQSVTPGTRVRTVSDT